PVVHRVPGLIQSLYAGAQPEPEAPTRHLVDVERAHREDEGTAREGPRDPGADPDLLGVGGQPGRLRDRAAEELRRPDAVDAGRFGGPPGGGEPPRGIPDRGDRDAIEAGHLASALLEA